MKFLRCLEVTFSLKDSNLVIKVEVEVNTQVDTEKTRKPQFGRRREGILVKRLAGKSLVNISQIVKI